MPSLEISIASPMHNTSVPGPTVTVRGWVSAVPNPTNVVYGWIKLSANNKLTAQGVVDPSTLEWEIVFASVPAGTSYSLSVRAVDGDPTTAGFRSACDEIVFAVT